MSVSSGAAAKPQYYIEQGVRRSVAARMAGNVDIPARLYVPGQPVKSMRIPLDQLHSPKTFVIRDYRFIRRTEYPTLVLRTEPPPIEVEPLGLPGQTKSIPLAQVALV